MGNDPQQLWIKPAMVEEGPFSDHTSGITYNNLTDEETEEAIASAEARGDTVVDLRDYGGGENLKNNCTVLAVDQVGSDYPPRHRPGK